MAQNSGQKLQKLLNEIGYGINVKPSTLDWVFEQQSTRPFLLWLCDNLRASNFLSIQDYEE